VTTLGVGVIGANNWADAAHLPGFSAYERARVVAICDVDETRARSMAAKYGAQRVYTDHHALLADPEIELVDVCTPTHTHLRLASDAIAAGKHVLCEKPIAEDAHDAFELAAAAQARGVRTKTGFTFRYSPAIRQLQAWIADGTLGEIFHVHGFEQNSQFLDPSVPLRQVAPDGSRDALVPSSIVGYGSHLVDLMRWCAGEFAAVCATMRNFIPERDVRGLGRARIAIEDGTAAIVEFASGAQGLLQTSFIAIGNYPGVEVRVYGSKGAAVARLIVERGVPETLHRATPDAVEFVPVPLPASLLAPGTTWHTPWPELYYRSLVRHFVDEILDATPPQATFGDGAKSQAIVDAVVRSHERRGWVEIGAPAVLAG
jgi:predicted dehydrogenase